MVFIFVVLFVGQAWFHRIKWWLSPSSASYGRRKQPDTENTPRYRSQPKPEWVRKEIIKMKALMLGNCSCIALPSAVHGGRSLWSQNYC